jgi:hypothetical protein
VTLYRPTYAFDSIHLNGVIGSAVSLTRLHHGIGQSRRSNVMAFTQSIITPAVSSSRRGIVLVVSFILLLTRSTGLATSRVSTSGSIP